MPTTQRVLRALAALAFAAMLAAACVGGGTGQSPPPTPGDPVSPGPTPPQPIAADGVLGAPDLPDDPDPDAVPANGGIDISSLLDPPTLQPPPDRSRPFDPEAGIFNLDHLIFIVLENRSFDHYFGTYPGADGLPRDANGQFDVCQPDPATGACHRPYHDTNFFDAGGPHGELGSHISIAGGQMNGFVEALRKIGNGCIKPHNADFPPCVAATPGPQGQPDVMGYHTGKELPIYWKYARDLHPARPDVRADRFLDPAGASVPGLRVVGDLHGPRGPDELLLGPAQPRAHPEAPGRAVEPAAGRPSPVHLGADHLVAVPRGHRLALLRGRGHLHRSSVYRAEGHQYGGGAEPAAGLPRHRGHGPARPRPLEQGVHAGRALRQPPAGVVGDARRRQRRASAGLDRGGAGLRRGSDQFGDGRTARAVAQDRDLPHLGRLGRLLRPRGAARRRRERVGPPGPEPR